MSKIFLILLLYFTFAHQSSAQLSTDYSVPELVRIFGRLGTLTLDRFLRVNEIGPIEQEVKFFCYNRQTNEFIQTFVNDSHLADKLDATKPLYIITHGWMSNINQIWAKSLRHEFITYLDVNACVVSWDKLANFDCVTVAAQFVPLVGDYLTEFVIQAINFGISCDDVTLVGHSFGAQISGLVGRNIIQRLGQILGKIFGLDPANLLYCSPVVVDINKRLDASDAKFVQVIHSTDGVLGCGLDQGHQDFRPDGGIIPQTGCVLPLFNQTVSIELLSCNHYQAVLYFLYSLNPANVFTGRQCASYSDFLLNRCSSDTDVLGPYTQKKPGRFYLRTSASAPFTPIPPTGR